MLTDTITVLEIISGGPSEKAGLLAGDRIISINDTTVAGQKWTQRARHQDSPRHKRLKSKARYIP